MQVGPPEPLSPISVAGTCAPRSRPPRAPELVRGLPSAMTTTPGRTASTLQPSVANSSSGTVTSRIPRSPRSCHKPDGQEWEIHDGEVVGDRRDHRHQVDQLGRPAPVRNVEDSNVAADERGELPGAGVVRSQGPPDAEQVGTQPQRVAALDSAWRLDPSDGRDALAAGPGLDRRGLSGTIRLPRPERDGATIGDEERVERVDEVRALEFRLEDMDPRTERSRARQRTRRARAGPSRGRPRGGSRAPAGRTPLRRTAPAASLARPAMGPTCSGRHIVER